MRIRTIKPEWLDDERLVSASSDARVLSVALITLADDAGRGRFGVACAARVFPTDPQRFYPAFAELEPWYVTRYTVRGQTYFEVTNFSKHQVVDSRRFRVLTPEPDEGARICDAGATHVRVKDARDRDRDQDQDQDQDQGPIQHLVQQDAAPRADEVRELFEHWQQATGSTRSKLDDKRRAKLRAALRLYGMDECKRVISGAMLSPHHMGQNDRGTKYLSIGLLFRDAEHMDRFISYNEKPPKPFTQSADPATAHVDALIRQTRKRAETWS